MARRNVQARLRPLIPDPGRGSGQLEVISTSALLYWTDMEGKVEKRPFRLTPNREILGVERYDNTIGLRLGDRMMSIPAYREIFCVQDLTSHSYKSNLGLTSPSLHPFLLAFAFEFEFL